MILIKNTLQSFKRISLSDLDEVKLMNRTDKKFCLHRRLLPEILEALKNEYSILAIKGETIFQYDNTYFDTQDDRMYISHQNGKRNRYKIRVRQYVQSNDNFLEVKFKTNKGRTIKERIKREDLVSELKGQELEFLKESCPYKPAELIPKIWSTFNRITLVDNNFTERVTIDTFLGFKNPEKEITLDNLVIIEVKQSKSNKPALITEVLAAHKIRQQGFSKYCIGRSLIEEKLKKNNFKPLLLKLKKEYFN
ncbi:MAG: polyphosphate polymerase domain-containing protein [Methylococcaceae bacterium]|nr:polyphosphate polymerase domain-containing protein [Prolixibacteraceae bacterium]